MGKSSRDKGARGELEVAELLREWWDPVEPGCLFKRTPMSGGWGSKEAREGFSTSGDLVTTARRFPFVVEVKRREGWSWKTLDRGAASPVWAWWKQAQKAADEQDGKWPALIWRKSREPWWLMLPEASVQHLTMLDLKSAKRWAWTNALKKKTGLWHPFAIPLAALLAEHPRLFELAEHPLAP